MESFTSKAYNLAKIEKRKTVSYKDLGKTGFVLRTYMDSRSN